MKAYTCQFGQGSGDSMPSPSHSETIYADSLGEAIDKAKAITKLRPAHAEEVTVSIVEGAADSFSLWSRAVAEVREG